MTDSTAFSTTHYHIPDQCAVERATIMEQEDAREAAKDKQRVINELHAEDKRLFYEQREKARLRGRHAMEKETLKQVSHVRCHINVHHCVCYVTWGGVR